MAATTGRIIWDETGERLAETGVKNGVIYPLAATGYEEGKAWNGLTSVNEAPTGAEASPFYADNHKYLELRSEEEFAGTIGCYTYPDEFSKCIGEDPVAPGLLVTAQRHHPFGFCYRTEIANDVDGLDHGFKIHLVYNSTAGVSPRDHTTMNESPELEELSFDFTATKVDVKGKKPTAHLILDSTKFTDTNKAKLTTIMDILYGVDAVTGESATEAIAPRLPLPNEIIEILAAG